jgi:hypothetical protein
MPDPIIIPNKQFGKKAAVVDPRVPKFSMVQKRLVAPAPSANWFAAVGEWGVLANNNYGCCVQAMCFHALLQFSTYAEAPITPLDSDVLKLYEQQGYVPSDPTTDNGSYVLGPTGVLPYWHTTGIMCDGALNKLTAFLQISETNPDAWKQAIFTFGGIGIGMNLPKYIVEPQETPYVWDVQGGVPAATAGGHEVWSDGYMTEVGEDLFEFVSWGERFRMTKAFMLQYVDETVVLYDRASLNPQGVDARGLPEHELLSLMSGLSGIA